jgi:hypothetical protein
MLFFLSLAAVIMLMHRMAAAVMDRPNTAVVRSILLWLGTTIVLMTAVRHFAREAAYGRLPLAEHGSASGPVAAAEQPSSSDGSAAVD